MNQSPNYPPQPGPATPPEPNVSRRAVRIAWMIGAGVLVFGLGIAVGAAGGDGSNAASPTKTVTVTAQPKTAAKDDKTEPAADATTAKPKPKPSPKPAGPPKEFGDGTYKVGKDVAAGTYRTAGPAEDSFGSCYWARTKDASGEFDAIIANGNPQGPASLTINTGEYVESSGCETWKKVG